MLEPGALGGKPGIQRVVHRDFARRIGHTQAAQPDARILFEATGADGGGNLGLPGLVGRPEIDGGLFGPQDGQGFFGRGGQEGGCLLYTSRCV